MAGRSVLIALMYSVFRSSDQGQPSLLVSLEVSATFDTVDHGTLLNRLLVGSACLTVLSHGSNLILPTDINMLFE